MDPFPTVFRYLVIPIAVLATFLLVRWRVGRLRIRDIGLSLEMASLAISFASTAHDHPLGQGLSMVVLVVVMLLAAACLALYTIATFLRGRNRQLECLLVGVCSILLSITWELVCFI